MSLINPALGRSQIEQYYRLHAWIYDLTRWTFLRGREELIRRAVAQCHPHRIFEVGCGTGKNLLHLGRLFPEAELWGLDLSPHMLARARKKLRGLATGSPSSRPPMTSRWPRANLIWWFFPMPYPCLTRAGMQP